MCLSDNTLANKQLAIVQIPDKINNKKINIQNYKVIDHKQIQLPRGLIDCTCYITGDLIDIKLQNVTLRPAQMEILDWVKEQPLPLDAVIVRQTAFGKTITSLAIACELKHKTLIIVNRTTLLKQWQEQIKILTGTTPGIIQGNTYEIKDITVAMLQTISKKHELNQFGTLIIDEVHTIPSEIFINVLWKINAAVRIGMSATPERTDQKHLVLYQHLNKMNRIMPVKKQTTTLCIINTNIIPEVKFNPFNDRILWPDYINSLANSEERNGLIFKVLLDTTGKVLLVSERLSQLKWLYKALQDTDKNVCLLTSKNKKLEDNFDVILASVSIAGTGLDIPDLNVLVFGTPKSNIVQIIGRIYRKKHNETTIIDFIDNHSISKSQYNKRLRQYRSEISQLKIKDTKEPRKITFINED